MAEQIKAKSVSSAAGRARCRITIVLLPIVPKDVEIDFQGLNLYGKSLYEISDKKDVILQPSEGATSPSVNGTV